MAEHLTILRYLLWTEDHEYTSDTMVEKSSANSSIPFWRISFAFLALTLVLAPALMTVEVSAATGSGDLNYIYVNDDKEVMIIKRVGLSGTVIIPEMIDGRPVTAIGDRAFSNLGSLRSVWIPDTVLTIGNGAFSSCSISSVRLPGDLTSIDASTFYNCQSLRAVTIPDSVTVIGKDAFQQCYSLQSIVLPEGLTSIGASAFNYCSALARISIPRNVTAIDTGFWGTFSHCTSLSAIDVDATSSSFHSEGGVLFSKDMTRLVQCPSGKSGVYSVPEGVVSIDESAFDSCARLTIINIPASVASLGGLFAFSGCAGLQAINVDQRNMNYASAGGVLYNKQMSDIIYRPGEDAPVDGSWSVGMMLIFGVLAVLVGIVVFIKASIFLHMFDDVVTGKDTGGVQDYMEFQTTMAILNNADQNNWDKKGK